MLKVLSIVGARPQFIKASVVSKAFKETGKIQEILVHTGQHFDHNMSQIFFDEMEIPEPSINLGINAMSHGAMTGRMIEEIEQTIIQEKPDWVLVYGDTNSTLAGALAAAKLHVKVAHVEAGLRSFNMKMPEEQNRILTDRLSTILFCPTAQAITNLTNEGYEHFNAEIHQVGDVMYDSAIHFAKLADSKGKNTLSFDEPYVLATCHRQENTDDPQALQAILESFDAISEHEKVVIPIHPRTRSKISHHQFNDNVEMIDPVGYLEMTSLIRGASLILTDSGGLQKEAFFFDKFCITMRDQTEWVELIDSGANQLTGANKEAIMNAYSEFKAKEFKKMDSLYGGGKASALIANHLLSYHG